MTDPTVPHQSGSVTPPPDGAPWPPADAYPTTSNLPSSSATPHTSSGAGGSFGSSHASGSSGTAQTAKEQAGQVKDTATGAAADVAGTAKDQASNVIGEVGQQSRQLWSQTTSELSGQASTQQNRIAGGLGEYAGQLRSMASNADKSGVVTDLVHQLADRGERAASYLSDREPTDLLDDVKAFARHRPLAFLGIAAGTGILVGRLSRGLFAEAKGGDPMMSSKRGERDPDHRPASLEEIPTSGNGAGPTYSDQQTDPTAGGVYDPTIDPLAGVPDAAQQPPVYGSVTAGTTTGATGPRASTLGDPVDRDLNR